MVNTKSKIFKEIQSYIFTTFGLAVMVLGWTVFLIPAELTGSGLSGISVIIYYATGFPVGITNFIANAILIIVAIRLMGAKFGVNTIYCIIMVSLLFLLFQDIVPEPIVQNKFMAALIGASMSGAGVGIAIANGGNTGGTDILALIINNYRSISPGRVILYCDVLIIGSSYFVFESIEKLVYGYVIMAVAAYVIDLVLDGAKQSYQMIIISRENKKIAERIAKETNRGVTFLKGQGGYTNEEVDVLLVMARKHDKVKIFRIIKEEDDNAFFSVGKVMGVFGQNFDKVKL